MKKQFLLSAVLCLSLTAFGQKVHQLASPSGNIRISVELTDQIQYDVTQGNQTLMDNCVIGLETANHQLGIHPKLNKVVRQNVNEELTPIVPLKFSTITNRYNQLLLKFKGGYSVEFRAFDDGFAYRFLTDLKGEQEIMNEILRLNFVDDCRYIFSNLTALRLPMKKNIATKQAASGKNLQSHGSASPFSQHTQR